MLPALVLTAGLGTRLDPITRLVAKPAVPVGERALIERVLGWLAAQDVRDVVLNLHHRAESITSLVGDGSHLGLRVRYSWEMPILGSAGGPRHALPLLDSDTFLIVNGDSLCDVELGPMAAAHRASGADITLAVIPNPAPARYTSVALDAHDRVIGFLPRAGSTKSPADAGAGGRRWHFVGVQIATAAVFEALPDGVAAESVHGLYRALIAAPRGGLHAHRSTASFFDVGTPADYLAAALALSNGAAIATDAAIAPGAQIAESVVWPGAAIGQHAALDHCIVTNVSVPAGFSASHKVLVPASTLRPEDANAGVQVTGDLACFALDQSTDRSIDR